MDKETAEKRAALKKKMEQRTGQRLDRPFDYRENKVESDETLKARTDTMNANFMSDGTFR